MDYANIWNKTLTQLRPTISYSNFKLFFENTAIKSMEGEKALQTTISVPNSFAKQSLEKKFANDITSSLSKVIGKPCSLRFVVDGGQVKEGKGEPANHPPLFDPQTSEFLEEKNRVNRLKKEVLRAHLKEDYTLSAKVFDPQEDPEHLKWLHMAISNAKAFIDGTFHGLGPKHLQRYLDEFCYRFNRRFFHKQIFGRILSSCLATGPLTYAELTR